MWIAGTAHYPVHTQVQGTSRLTSPQLTGTYETTTLRQELASNPTGPLAHREHFPTPQQK